MMPREAGKGRGLFGTITLVAWSLAGACASEGGDAPLDARPDASADADDADAGPTLDAGDGGDSAAPPSSCSDDGWCVVSFPEIEGVTLSAIWGSGPNDVWAVGSAGTIAHYDGTRWAVLPKADGGTEQTLFTVWGSGPNDVWAGSTERVLLHCDGWDREHARATWTLAHGSEAWRKRLDDRELSAPPGKFRVWSLWGTGPNDLWMLPSDSIRAWHADGFRNGNVDWMPVLDYFPDTEITFKGAWGPGPNDVWLVGSQGKILRARGGYQNGLVDWDVVNSGTREDLNAVWGTAFDDVWA
ncbi:MAG: Type fimbrial biosis protein PilY1, partial [Labilithrix sp.]|nr:Type fimbrial biosis protein PilY1 [Labilithrix sp.]